MKTDDHVHIAHNDYISSGVQIAAHALLSGSVYVGENAWLGPITTIIDHVDIGKDSFIGSGTNVVKEVDQGSTVVGNPAKKIRMKYGFGSVYSRITNNQTVSYENLYSGYQCLSW